MKPEAQLHRAVAAYLRLALKPPTIWTTIGHGGGGKVRGAQLKGLGMQAGWPDILVLHPSNDMATDCTILGIELKAPKGVQSADQKAIERAFDRANAFYRVCRSLRDVDSALAEAGIEMHARAN